MLKMSNENAASISEWEGHASHVKMIFFSHSIWFSSCLHLRFSMRGWRNITTRENFYQMKSLSMRSLIFFIFLDEFAKSKKLSEWIVSISFCPAFCERSGRRQENSDLEESKTDDLSRKTVDMARWRNLLWVSSVVQVDLASLVDSGISQLYILVGINCSKTRVHVQ